MSANPERHLCLGEGDCLAAYCSHSRLKLYFLITFPMYLALKEFKIKFRPLQIILTHELSLLVPNAHLTAVQRFTRWS